MHGEEGRDECAASGEARQAIEHPKQQRGVGGMEQDIDQVESERAGAEQLGIHHVGDPEQRQPPVFVGGLEGPSNIFPRETGKDMLVFRNVQRVVEIEKIKARGWCKERQGQAGQATGYQPFERIP